MKSKIKLFSEFVFLFIVILSLFYHQLIIYAISQAKGQLHIVMSAKLIDEVLLDNSVADSVKQKLILINEIKQFAVDSLGINPSENYSTFYDQTNQPKLQVITASLPFEFKAKEWTFPVLGAVPYKGFFNKIALRKEYLQLVSDDYDIDVYSPSGWSTLGWFKDPVLSNMLKKKEGELANLIIHELTHGTLYVKNDATFNENLANFIGDKGAEAFLKNRFGVTSSQYLYYLQDKIDNKIYTDYILSSSEKLKQLYASFTIDEGVEVKKKKKQKLIIEIVVGVNKLPINNKKKYFKYTQQALFEGNAFFMAFSRYDSQYEYFEKEYIQNFNANIKAYLNYLKNKYPSL